MLITITSLILAGHVSAPIQQDPHNLVQRSYKAFHAATENDRQAELKQLLRADFTFEDTHGKRYNRTKYLGLVDTFHDTAFSPKFDYKISQANLTGGSLAGVIDQAAKFVVVDRHGVTKHVRTKENFRIIWRRSGSNWQVSSIQLNAADVYVEGRHTTSLRRK